MERSLLKPLMAREKGPGKSINKDRSSAQSVRIAVYEDMSSLPEVVELESADRGKLIDLVAEKTFTVSQEAGGRMPQAVIREIVENLIHADFKEPVITIFNNGNAVRISDQGPGIEDRGRALAPGLSTASSDMKKHIRGVGSGLPVVSEILKSAGGQITIEDNLGGGTVVTLSIPDQAADKQEQTPDESEKESYALTERQKKALFLVTELGPVGPSRIAGELSTSLSSAYRDLTLLEQCGLVKVSSRGKRALTQKGMDFLESTLAS